LRKSKRQVVRIIYGGRFASAAGFPAVTKTDVFGRGKQKGIQVGEIRYDEIPKEMLQEGL